MASQSYQMHNEGLNTDVAKFAPEVGISKLDINGFYFFRFWIK